MPLPSGSQADGPFTSARVRSSTNSSNASSSLPSSPGPSVSLRATRSSTPTPSNAPIFSPNASFLSAGSRSSSRQSYGVPSPSNGLAAGANPYGGPVPSRTQSWGNMSISTASAASGARAAGTGQHNRRRPPLLGATYSSSSSSNRGNAGRGYSSRNQISSFNNTLSPVPGVPPILINGTESLEDVDVAAIGRIPISPAAHLQGDGKDRAWTTTPEATAAGVDSLFVRFGVKEVKTVAVRGKQKAEAKREELRTMVGERYRDLLGAADSIVRMSRSSHTLLRKLDRAREECDKEFLTAKVLEEDMTRSQTYARDAEYDGAGHTPYSIATVVKLLLDCPEYIWRAIEREDFLSAARLESIAGAVYREVVRETTNETERFDENRLAGGLSRAVEDSELERNDLIATFPVVEEQWVALQQLTPQIIAKARSALRRWKTPTSKTRDQLAAILMLQGSTSDDVLQDLLGQRHQALADMYSAEAAGSFMARRPSARPDNPAFRPQQKPPLTSADDKSSEFATEKIKEGLDLILATLLQARAIFKQGSHQHQPSSLRHFLQVLKETAAGNTVTAEVDSPEDAPSDVQVPSLLSILPNAHLFTRYLPPRILSHTPYLDEAAAQELDSDGSLERALSQWFTRSVDSISSGIESILLELGQARQLAVVRSGLNAYLQSQRDAPGPAQSSQEVSELSTRLEVLLSKRFNQIYRSSLDRIAGSIPDLLRRAVEGVAMDASDAAAAFVFSSGLPFPHASGHSLPAGLTSTTSGKALDGRQAQMDPVHVFKSALNCRLSGRTPKMDRCLSELELASSATRQDVASWLFEAAVEGGRATSEGAKAYELEVSKTIEIVRSALQTALEQASSVPQELFLGALVMHLAVDSSALRDLMLLQYDQPLPTSVTSGLFAIESASLGHWRNSAVESAIQGLKESLSRSIHQPSLSNSSHEPADHVYACLLSLQSSLDQVGPHRLQASQNTLPSLLAEFERRLLADVVPQHVQAIDTLNQRPRMALRDQLKADLTFLKLVLSGCPSFKLQDEAWQRAISSLEQDDLVSVPSSLGTAAQVALQRTQLLLPFSMSTGFDSPATRRNRLLPYGPPSAISGSGSVSKLSLSKPGPRFALLPVNSSAA